MPGVRSIASRMPGRGWRAYGGLLPGVSVRVRIRTCIAHHTMKCIDNASLRQLTSALGGKRMLFSCG